MATLIGCTSTKAPVVVEFRGNPISGALTGVLRSSGGPYLATDTLIVPAGQQLTIEPGTEIRFEPKVLFLVYGKITAVGSEAAPITFTSGLKYPNRGDWDGIWLIGADNASNFEYCRFLYGSKYGRRYTYRTIAGQLDSTVFEYGCLTLRATNATVKRSWFLASGFHGVLCDSAANPTIENCVFYDNAGHGVFVRHNAAPRLRFNIITENDDYGVFCSQIGESNRATLDMSYNIVWSNFSGEFNTQAPLGFGRIALENGNLDSCDFQYNVRINPGYVDAPNWDFHLSACSGAIDAGPAGVNMDGDGTRLEFGVFSYHYRPGELRRLITNNHLIAANSPYYMSCNAFLPSGQTLLIDEGVEVRVEGLYALRVMGHILASGSASRPIKFISAKRTPARGDWIGFEFPSGGDGGTVLSHVSILHARWGIRLTSRDIELSNCEVSLSDSVGIVCENGSMPKIKLTRLADNSIAGILCQFNSSPSIENCTVTGGAGYGLLALESSRPIVSNSIFANIGTDGIRLDNLSNAKITNNVFALNGYYGLYCNNNSSPDVRNNIFYRNGTELRGGVGVFSLRSSLPSIFYNAFWGQPDSPVSISSDTTAYDQASTLMSEPMFVNTVTGDWHLQAGSPCRHAGDPLLLNPDGSRSDIGAYGGPGAVQ